MAGDEYPAEPWERYAFDDRAIPWDQLERDQRARFRDLVNTMYGVDLTTGEARRYYGDRDLADVELDGKATGLAEIDAGDEAEFLAGFPTDVAGKYPEYTLQDVRGDWNCYTKRYLVDLLTDEIDSDSVALSFQWGHDEYADEAVLFATDANGDGPLYALAPRVTTTEYAKQLLADGGHDPAPQVTVGPARWGDWQAAYCTEQPDGEIDGYQAIGPTPEQALRQLANDLRASGAYRLECRECGTIEADSSPSGLFDLPTAHRRAGHHEGAHGDPHTVDVTRAPDAGGGD